MLLIVLCSFSVPFGKYFSKIVSSLRGLNVLDIGSTGIAATNKFVEVAP